VTTPKSKPETGNQIDAYNHPALVNGQNKRARNTKIKKQRENIQCQGME
jgi:hypothetical protein